MPISFSSGVRSDTRNRGAGVTAVLGPTNTGKTHLAIERMLAHSCGMIGLPLRLLAREVYNKCVERVGADAGRAHHRRGEDQAGESALLGLDGRGDAARSRRGVRRDRRDPARRRSRARPCLHRPHAQPARPRGNAGARRRHHAADGREAAARRATSSRRPRLSQLTFAGEKKLTRLPRRSAIVAFSADEVYAIAELIRRQRGGAAVVLGSLSPRTRNAQVALYQSGDVDYLVATDAIGMGLNLDVDHVAFASDRKFDGYQFRKLNPAELAQIAGRAGRAMRDGTFGTTGRCPPFETELAQALESHTFDPREGAAMAQHRRSTSPRSARCRPRSRRRRPSRASRARRSPKTSWCSSMLRATTRCAHLPQTRAAIERLWEVCQVPDYRKISPAAHAELVITLYGFLMREGTIPPDWFAAQVAQADRTDGDIDTLVEPDRPHQDLDLCGQPSGLARRSRALAGHHARRRGQAVRRAARASHRALRRPPHQRVDAAAAREHDARNRNHKTGEVVVEGHPIGRLDGFQFAARASRGGPGGARRCARPRRRRSPARSTRAPRSSRRRRTSNSCSPPTARIRWLGEPVGKLAAGDDVLRPRVRILADEHLTGASRDAVQARLDLWIKAHIEKLLGPLFALAAAEDITGIARGVAFQLTEALGVLERHRVAEEVKGLDQAARAALRKYGVRFGAYHLYLPNLLKPGAARARDAALGAEARDARHQGARRRAASRAPAGARRSRPTRTCRRRSIASSAIACAASARCASIFWSGSPI